MPFTIFVFGLLVLGFLLFLRNEKRNRDLSIRKIPIRIHVNGTRGKSSVTRLIHSILVEEGWKVFGKTTGSAPSLLFPDRSERRIFRNKISIGEQASFLRFASYNNAQAVVLECMAVQPVYQKDSENLLIVATHSVITNVRPDHGESIGSEKEIWQGFSETIPKEGVLICGKSVFDSDASKYFEEISKQRNTKILNSQGSHGETSNSKVQKFGSDSIDEVLNSMRYPEHRENVEIAVRVCETLGVTGDSILQGILKTVPDPGALKIQETNLNGTKQRFVFAFAANDTVSWENILKENLESKNDPEGFNSVIVVFHSKRERPIRTIEFAKFFGKGEAYSKIYFFGAWKNLFRSHYKGNAELIFCENEYRFDHRDLNVGSYLWIGAGNYQGEGRIRLQEYAESIKPTEDRNEWKS